MAKIKRIGEDFLTTLPDGLVASALANAVNIYKQNNIVEIEGYAYYLDTLDYGGGSNDSLWELNELSVLVNKNEGDVLIQSAHGEGRFVSSIGSIRYLNNTIEGVSFYGFLQDYSETDKYIGIAISPNNLELGLNEYFSGYNSNRISISEDGLFCSSSAASKTENSQIAQQNDYLDIYTNGNYTRSRLTFIIDDSSKTSFATLETDTLFDDGNQINTGSEYDWQYARMFKRSYGGANNEFGLESSDFYIRLNDSASMTGENYVRQSSQTYSQRIIDYSNLFQCDFNYDTKYFHYRSDNFNDTNKNNSLKVSDFECEFIAYYTGIAIDNYTSKIGFSRNGATPHIGFFDSDGIPQFEITGNEPTIVEGDYMNANPDTLNDLKNHYNANTELLLQLRTMVINFGLAKAV